MERLKNVYYLFRTVVLIPGFSVQGVPEISHRIVQKVLPNAENLQHWTKTVRPIIRDRFERWSQSDEVSLFESMSELGVIVTLYVMVGPAFAMKHGDEIVPLVDGKLC